MSLRQHDPVQLKTTNWVRSGPSFGGTALTSRGCGRKVAASDQCVALERVCPRCYSRYLATVAAPEHGCA